MKRILAACALAAAAARAQSAPEGLWIEPLREAALRGQVVREAARPYSQPAAWHGIAGALALSCEHVEGRPCGDGAGAALELDSAAGFGSWASVFTRVRLWSGTSDFGAGVTLDRAYVKLQAGPLQLQAGRDALALGPAVRTALQVSDHAAPQDGIRARLRPVALPFAREVRLSLLYFVDRLRAPQVFAGALLTGMRGQLDFGGRVQLGGTRLLQLGGRGAPDFGGLEGFVLEHFGRTREAGTTSAENNRLSFDVALRLPELRGARLYYELSFEDTRNPIWNSFLYDADHLVGLELGALDLGPLRRLFVEGVQTSRISQEHWIWTTGMTNAGLTLGSPLGPEGMSLWLRADLEAGPLTLSPWGELLRFSADRYGETQARGIFVVERGPIEHRQRLGLDARSRVARGWTATVGLFGERVADFAFEGPTRLNAGLTAALIWTP